MTRFVEKPWGGEEIFAETDRYVGKILSIRAGHALSLQYHVRKDETMRVLEGSCELHAGSAPGSRALEVVLLSPGSTARIRSGVVHRVVALTDVRIIEVSTPEVADVVRLEDRYGREGTSKP
ncbi:MAG: cupin [Acidobacteriia bacterium]|nr:cupin [Terriglobia bacterium]